MTMQEAKEHYSISCSNQFDFEKFIDEIYDDFESKTCENCKLGIIPRDSRYRECVYWKHIRVKTHGCTEFKRKNT